ncbi:general transcription factor 3C polypeptide 6 isoform X4 [Athene noctua]|uniref:general transcription factor 3C polypeptide 6 isoform X4 n=1 Tax=Athene noctua TaxID=126797 RepID=UPI003EBFC9FE
MAAAESTEEGGRKDGVEEDEVEEQLVMVELSGIIDSDFLEKCENKCKILGIETERPILQVDRYVFAGEYEDTLGTCVVFEENTEHGGVEWLQIKDRDFSYSRPNTICSFLREKEDSEESVQAQDKLTEESEGEVSGEGNSDMNCDLEKQHNLEIDASLPLPDSPASGAEDSLSESVALDDAPP